MVGVLKLLRKQHIERLLPVKTQVIRNEVRIYSPVKRRSWSLDLGLGVVRSRAHPLTMAVGMYKRTPGESWLFAIVKETYGRGAEARKTDRTDGSELQATKYAGGNGTRKRGGKAEHITQGWKTWPQLMCCALASRNCGVFRFTDGTKVYGVTRGFETEL